MKKLNSIVFSLAVVCSSQAAIAADVVLSGDYITLGVSNSGALINHNTSTGLQFAGVDFIFPGTPFAFYSIGAAGSYDVAGGYAAGNNPFGAKTADVSSIVGSPYAISSKGVAYGLSFSQSIYFDTTEKTIHVDASFTNKTSATVNNVVYSAGLDPDQGVAQGVGFGTFNILGSGGQASVTATAGLYSITMTDVGHSSQSVASVSGWETNPYTLLNGGNVGDGDNTIALAYNLGDIKAGQTVGIQYTYTIAAVPEPDSYAMFLAGLGLMGAIARRRKSA